MSEDFLSVCAELRRTLVELGGVKKDRDSLLEQRAQFKDLWEHDQYDEALRVMGYGADEESDNA